MSKIIEKKILPEYFEEIKSGNKTFELRLADWECSRGDTLTLIEVDKTGKTTGRTLSKKVGYVGRTKSYDFWSKEDIEKHGYQIISLLDEVSV